MDNDDTPIGRVLSRREALILLGASGAMLATGAAFRPMSRGETGPRLPGCVVSPEQTEGPYFVDERLNRSDIRSDPGGGAVSAGTPLTLTLLVSQVTAGACAPLSGAVVDLWHCDALGVYSDVQDPRFNTVGKRFLRGYQLTDQAGRVSFQTIYPGWYSGRAVHLHFKIRTPASSAKALEFTSQLYFEEDFTDRVHSKAPYATKGKRDTRNTDDRIFRRGGEQLVLAPQAKGSGYEASFEVGLKLA